jgi:hypothetical protein
MKENIDKYQDLPIFKKGREILEVVSHIADIIPENIEHLQEINGFIIEDAAKLSIKIASAHHAGLYDLKMEAAAIIRKDARDLLVQYRSLKMFGFKEYEYFQIVRNLLEEYRLLFIEWVAGFDKQEYVIDRWGLFNPPGVGPFDKDPDDDLPFDKHDFPFDDND